MGPYNGISRMIQYLYLGRTGYDEGLALQAELVELDAELLEVFRDLRTLLAEKRHGYLASNVVGDADSAHGRGQDNVGVSGARRGEGVDGYDETGSFESERSKLLVGAVR